MICNYSNTVAIKHGINAALIVGYIDYCIEKCMSRMDDHGCSWVRLTQKSLMAIFPFMGEKAVRNAIKKLKKANIISVRQFKKECFDHANFYALTEYGKTVIKGDDEFE